MIYLFVALLFFSGQRFQTGEKGFEPLTSGFGNHYSTIETIPLFSIKKNKQKITEQVAVGGW